MTKEASNKWAASTGLPLCSGNISVSSGRSFQPLSPLFSSLIPSKRPPRWGGLARKHEATFPRSLCTYDLFFFSRCNFFSACCESSFPLGRPAPLRAANTDLPPPNWRHVFNNTSLLHVGYFALTPHFWGRLWRRHAGPVALPDVCLGTARLCSIRCWLAPVSDVARRPPVLPIPVKTTALTSILIRTQKAAARAAQIGDEQTAAMIYGDVAGKGQRVRQIFKDTC